MDYRYLRWQVVDTPGILDHPLDERNTIEMQAITALAHLQCSVLYFVDISEQCGFTIAAQVALFESIKPLFVNKQLILVVNKIDVVAMKDLSEENRALILGLAESAGVEVMEMSNVSEEGVMAVKNRACDLLLQARVDARLTGKKVSDVLNRLTVAGADLAASEPFIPESVHAARAAGLLGKGRKTEKHLMLEGGGAGVYSMDTKKGYLLADDAWKYDAVPEIMDGKNVADFVDPEIEAKLDALEREQEQLEEEHLRTGAMASDESDLDETDTALLGAIREKKTLTRDASHIARNSQSARMPRTARQGAGRSMSEVVGHLEGVGVDTAGIAQRGRKRTRDRHADKDRAGEEDGMAVDGEAGESSKRQRSKSRELSRTRSASRGQSLGASERGLSKPADREKAAAELKKLQKSARGFGKHRRAGESDRKSHQKNVRHMVAGKSPGLGTKSQR
jgi:nucleolar GTP-binding protein